MKTRAVFVGFLLGAAGVVLLLLYMRRFEDDVSGGRRVGLLVAVAPIVRGKPITDEMLGVREVPQAYLDDRSVRASEKAKILGLRATANVSVAQTLAWADVTMTSDDQRDVSALVQPGNRAAPIKVWFEDEIPLIHPGDFVDVIGVFDDTRDASVLLQRVLVLSVGSETSSDRTATDKRPLRRAAILTVSASLQEAQLLALAMDKGKLTVVIRNPDDQRVTETPPDMSASMLQDSQKRLAVQTSRRRATGPVKLEVEHAR
jgi:pilus assembly protein CpaB